jgi:neuroligin
MSLFLNISNEFYVSGQSAGAAAVSHLVLSEMSRTPKQLFHRAIAMSGSAMNSWAVTENPIPPALRVAELATCYNPTEDTNEAGEPDLPKISACMKTIGVEQLTTALNEYQVRYCKLDDNNLH